MPALQSALRQIPRSCAAALCAIVLFAAGANARAQDANTERKADAGAAGVAAPATTLPTIVVESKHELEKAGVTRFTGEELSRIPGGTKDPMRAVQALPGVVVADDTSTVPAIWGAGPADNAYYVDFAPIGYLFHADGIESVLNPEQIKTFDLYAAGYGPQYADVVGAVFDISLRDPRNDRIGGVADLGFLSADLLLEGPVADGLSFLATGRRTTLNLMRKSYTDTTYHIDYRMPNYDDYEGKLLWKANRYNRVSLDLSGAADKLAATIQPASPFAAQDPLITGLNFQNSSFRSTTVLWEAELGEHASNKLAAGRMAEGTTQGVAAAGSFVSNTVDLFAREQLRLQPLADHTVTLGGSLDRWELALAAAIHDPRCTGFNPACLYTTAPLLQSTESVRQNSAALFADEHWQFLPAWAFSTGVRFSRDNYLRTTYTEPRLALEWAWSPQTLVSAAWGRHNERPSVEQELPVFGNPQLRHLRSTDAVLGVSQKQGDDWSWRAQVYRKTFSDLVLTDANANYVNAGSGTAHGLVLTLNKEPTTPFFGFVGLSFARSQRRNDLTGATFPFDYDEPVIATVVANYKQSEHWQYGLRASFHSGVPYTPVIGTTTNSGSTLLLPVYGVVDSRRAPNYYRLDLRVDRTINKNFSAYLDIINVLARQNVSGFTYSADYSSTKASPQLPFLPAAGLQYRF